MNYALVRKPSGWINYLIKYTTKGRSSKGAFKLKGCSYVYGPDSAKGEFNIDEDGCLVNSDKSIITFTLKDIFEADNDQVAEDIYIKKLVEYAIGINRDFEKEREEFKKELAEIDEIRKKNFEAEKKRLIDMQKKHMLKNTESAPKKRGRPPKQK